MNINHPGPSEEDHGKVVAAPRVHRLWAWIFPALAAAAGLWLLWSNWTSKGPEIQVHFTEAPGIQSGKTVLMYRGVTSGNVTGVSLNKGMDGVLVTIRLKAFASDLASEGTDFWIDQPVISLQQTTGLDSIIQGNSIKARMGAGASTTTFKGLSRAPLTPLDSPSLEISLRAPNIPFLARDAPVYHKGVAVGLVRDKKIDKSGGPSLQVIIDKEHAHLVLDTSRFWILPATSLQLSARGASLDIAGLAALIQGGIAFDAFVPDGKPVEDHADFELAPQEFSARADGPRFKITFENAQGLLAGETRITYLGQPVGYIETLQVDSQRKLVDATARLEASFSPLLTSDSKFTLIRPSVSLRGVSGLETLISGAIIALESEGQGEPALQFVGNVGTEGIPQDGGVIVDVQAENLPNLDAGAPVYHRGLVAGEVLEKRMGEGEIPILKIQIHQEYQAALRTNSRFWRVAATSVSAGPGMLEAKIQGLSALLDGGIAFDAFEEPGNPASGTDNFQLFDSETAARAISEPIRIAFKNGQGLLAGKTALRYLGLPVGLVDSVRTTNGRVEVTARVNSGYEFLRRKGSIFAIVQAQVSLQGLTGLETILSGVYIECIPGTGSFTDGLFLGQSSSEPELLEREGLEIRITSQKTAIRAGAPIIYRDMTVGEITKKTLSADGKEIELTAVIDRKYQSLLRANSHFWDAGGVEASIGFIKLKVKSQTLIAPDGKVAFANPSDPGDPVKPGHVFLLSNKPLK